MFATVDGSSSRCFVVLIGLFNLTEVEFISGLSWAGQCPGGWHNGA